MSDDPFARAVRRAEAAEHERASQVRAHRRGVVTRWTNAGFRIHFTVYVVISALLILIWAMTSTAFPWPFIVIVGWGAGVAAHWSVTRELAKPSTPPQPKPAADPFATAIPNAPAPAATQSAPKSTAEELEKLAKLHKKGALTDDEFAAAKADLLG